MPILDGKYYTPCQSCKHRGKPTVMEPCRSCISTENLVLPRYGDSTYTHYEYEEKQINSVRKTVKACI